MKNSQLSKLGSKIQLVTFYLGEEIYGIEIFKIREVLNFTKVTRIFNAPDFVDGIIEIREQVIPVVNLKRRLGVKETVAPRRRIIILEISNRPLGIIVDDIYKVIYLDETRYESLPPDIVANEERNCIQHLAKTEGDGLIIVLAPERILTFAEKESFLQMDLDSPQIIDNNNNEPSEEAAK